MGTKSDLPFAVSTKDVLELRDRIGASEFVQTSAFDGTGLEILLRRILLLERPLAHEPPLEWETSSDSVDSAHSLEKNSQDLMESISSSDWTRTEDSLEPTPLPPIKDFVERRHDSGKDFSKDFSQPKRTNRWTVKSIFKGSFLKRSSSPPVRKLERRTTAPPEFFQSPYSTHQGIPARSRTEMRHSVHSKTAQRTHHITQSTPEKSLWQRIFGL